MKTDDFDFILPEDRIALRPADPRGSARLLQLSPCGDINDKYVSDLPNLLRPGDVLVLNETRVLRAALDAVRAARPQGGGGDVSVQVNLHKKVARNMWRAFARPAKRLKVGDVLTFSETLTARVKEKRGGGDVSLEFNLAGDALAQAIEQHGAPPLPPYIARRRAPDVKDSSDYQTVFARQQRACILPMKFLAHYLIKVLKYKDLRFTWGREPFCQ
jgi:S-adenosylmethionine:tRNA ribosyltransferase-isomerase